MCVNIYTAVRGIVVGSKAKRGRRAKGERDDRVVEYGVHLPELNHLLEH